MSMKQTNKNPDPPLADAAGSALADKIARAIFAAGDEPGSPCNRIQFKGGKWPDAERNQGGYGEAPLAKLIALVISQNSERSHGANTQKHEHSKD